MIDFAALYHGEGERDIEIALWDVSVETNRKENKSRTDFFVLM